MSKLKELVSTKMKPGKLSKKLKYAHRNSLNYRLSNPEGMSLGLFNKLSGILEIPRPELIQAADFDIEAKKLALAIMQKAAKKKRKK